MKILITGASGFVGKNLVHTLSAKHQINSKSVRYKPNQKYSITEEVVIHLAGKAHDLKKVSNPKEYYEANFELTKQLFDAFLESNATVFIFMSTVKAAADVVRTQLTEEILPNPKTHYGIAKLKAENYILEKQLNDNKKVYILRPCMIHGPGNKGNLNLLYNLVQKGIPWPLGAFKNKRSFLSIGNLIFVIQELLKNKKISSGVYNLSDNEPISTNELFQLICMSLEKKNKIIKFPKSLITLLSKLGDIIKLPLTTERLNKLTENYVVNNNKICAAIKKPLPIATEEGLVLTFKSFKNE